MRCRGENCRTTRKNKLNKAKCWSKWGLCGKCAVEKYPHEYRKKILESFKEEHKYKLLEKPGINGYQGMKEGIKIGIV